MASVRGNAIVIVNESFEGSAKERRGASVDKDNFMSIVGSLGFKCINEKDSLNVSSKAWQHVGDGKKNCGECLSCRIKTTATTNDNTDCFLFALSSHGDEKEGSMKIKFSDGQKVELKSVVDILNADCLKGKKKILIVQACRFGSDKGT